MERNISAEEATILSCERPKVSIFFCILQTSFYFDDLISCKCLKLMLSEFFLFLLLSQHGAHLIDSYYDCPTCAYWLAEAVSHCNEKTCRKCISPFRNE